MTSSHSDTVAPWIDTMSSHVNQLSTSFSLGTVYSTFPAFSGQAQNLWKGKFTLGPADGATGI